MRDVIPEPVFVSIQDHLVRVGNSAQSGWEAGREEEDTLTGDLGAHLRQDWSYQRFNGQTWAWCVNYKKFRGRGPGPPFETTSGADGIVQVEVRGSRDKITVFKGILFQAKKNARLRSGALASQVQKMEQIAPHGSVIFDYRSNGYGAIEGDLYLKGRENQTDFQGLQPLGSFLGDSFLGCASGLRGMYYDAVRGKLLIPRDGTQVEAIDIRLGNRIMIEVENMTGI